jgi:predicted metal-binding membrane protein
MTMPDIVHATRADSLMAPAGERISNRGFVAASALFFAGSTALTIVCCASMQAMPAMPMSGGWTLSMTWMCMPGQSWLVSAAQFLAMWSVMMAAMMSPSLMPMLWRYRQAIGRRAGTRLDILTALVGGGYFSFWSAMGMMAYALGRVVSAAEMQLPGLARFAPVAGGAAVVICGMFQFTAWKSHHLACCRDIPLRDNAPSPNAAAAWRHGLRLGLHCSYCCAGLTTILFVVGVMDLRAMVLVTIAITAERLLADGERTARVIGVMAIAAGLFQIIRTV